MYNDREIDLIFAAFRDRNEVKVNQLTRETYSRKSEVIAVMGQMEKDGYVVIDKGVYPGQHKLILRLPLQDIPDFNDYVARRTRGCKCGIYLTRQGN